MRRSFFLAGLAAMLGSSCQESTKALPVARAAALPDSADQLLFNPFFVLTDAGVRRAEVTGDTAYMYEENTRTELKKLKTDFFTATGAKNATLTSREGTYNSRIGNMEARGNVVVITTDGRKLETPQLKYDPSRNEISSDSAFVLTESDRRVEGIGFVSDPDMKVIHTFKGSKAFGQSVTIPRK